MAERRSFEVTATSSGPPETVFALLADGAGWSRWAGPYGRNSAWEREGSPTPGGVGAIRRLGRPPIVSREEIVESEPPRRLAYTILSGFPVRDYLAIVHLEPTADGGTRIRWSASFEPQVPGTGPLMRAGGRYVVGQIAKRLAAAAGRP